MLDFLRGIWYNIGGRAAGGDRTIYTRPTGRSKYLTKARPVDHRQDDPAK
jgi:hypothetical protein